MRLSTQAAAQGLAVGLLILVLVLIAGCDAKEGCSADTTPSPSVEKPFVAPDCYKLIKVGMAYDEVVSLFGDGDRFSGADYGWSVGNAYIHIYFEDGLVTGKAIAGKP